MTNINRPVSRAAVDHFGWRETIPAGAPARRHKSGWRRRQAFSAAAGCAR